MHRKVYDVAPEWSTQALVDAAAYERLYARSVQDPEAFWGEMGAAISWIQPFTRVKHTSFEPHNVFIKWYEDGTTNVAMNCVDRHLQARAEQTAIVWEGDDPKLSRRITYRQLHEEVCRFANVLKKHGVRRGDRVMIYMPMIPEAAFAMLACARIGAVHSRTPSPSSSSPPTKACAAAGACR
jgi:acetyl-CoA synthetase